MAVHVVYDSDLDTAALICTTSEWAFGPVFRGPDADEQAQEFVDWFASGAAARAATEIGVHQIAGRSGADPRHWDDQALEQLLNRWRALRAQALGEAEVLL